MQIQLQDYFLNFLSLALSFSMLHICNNFGVTKVSLKSVEGVIRGKKKNHCIYLLIAVVRKRYLPHSSYH